MPSNHHKQTLKPEGKPHFCMEDVVREKLTVEGKEAWNTEGNIYVGKH